MEPCSRLSVGSLKKLVKIISGSSKEEEIYVYLFINQEQVRPHEFCIFLDVLPPKKRINRVKTVLEARPVFRWKAELERLTTLEAPLVKKWHK